MSKDITVQIKVKEYGPELYKINETGSFIRKELCTVIETVEHVQELEQQIKDLQSKLNTYEIEESVTMKHVQPEPTSFESSNVEFERLAGKWVNKGFNHTINDEKPFPISKAPEPQRKSLGMHEGVEVYEGTKVWFVDIKHLKIRKSILSKSSYINMADKDGVYYSKFYLTPKEVNARLKDIVTDKARNYTFSINSKMYYDTAYGVIDYAIEAFEKDHNITYLPE